MQGDSEGYYSPENSLLQHVLTAGKGIPISLAIIHAAVGRRAGLPISCVNMPRHFMNRFGDYGHPDERFIDAFDGGKMLTRCVYPNSWLRFCKLQDHSMHWPALMAQMLSMCA